MAILAAALELVNEIGYDRVTVDAIAKRARASKATMYRNWSGKAELIAEALRRNAQREDLVVPDTGSLRGDLLSTVEDIAHSFDVAAGPSLLGLTEAVRQDTELRELVRSQVETRRREVAELIVARALTRGETVDPTNQDLVLELAFAQLFTTTLLHGEIPSAGRRERFVDDVMLPLLHATP
jgi:AcrR family transcriptional regulator